MVFADSNVLVLSDSQRLALTYAYFFVQANRTAAVFTHVDTLVFTYAGTLVITHTNALVLGNAGGLVLTYRFCAVLGNRSRFVFLDGFRSIAHYCYGFVVTDRGGAVVVDVAGFVIFNQRGQVFLRLEIDHLGTGSIVEHQFIEVGKRRIKALTFDTGLFGCGRKAPWWRHCAVVQATQYNRSVGIAVDEVNQHFFTDTRSIDRTVSRAGRTLRYPNPVGAVFIHFAVAVPMELDFNIAIFVGINLFSGRARYRRRLCAQYFRFWRFKGRAVWVGFGQYAE